MGKKLKEMHYKSGENTDIVVLFIAPCRLIGLKNQKSIISKNG